MDIPVRPPTFADILKSLKDPARGPQLRAEVCARAIGPAPGGKYRHWDTLRHIQPPDGLSSAEWWAGIKFARSLARREVPLLKDKTGRSRFIQAPKLSVCRLDAIKYVIAELQVEADEVL